MKKTQETKPQKAKYQETKPEETKPQKTQQEESLENEIYFYSKKCQLYTEQLENLTIERLNLRREQAFFENELDKSRELLFALRIRQEEN